MVDGTPSMDVLCAELWFPESAREKLIRTDNSQSEFHMTGVMDFYKEGSYITSLNYLSFFFFFPPQQKKSS